MSDHLRVVVAPDSFKGSLAAVDVAAAIRDGWKDARPQDTVAVLPQADGGEGTLDAIQASTPGSTRHQVGDVTGPDGRPVAGEWLELPDGTGVVEMAQMSGLPLMNRLDPLGATSRGLGEVIATALDAGVRRLLVGVGGSASTDAGLPALEAIGARRPPRDGAFVLSDVTAPLLGVEGAATVFAPQKGATSAEIVVLEERLTSAAQQLGGDPDEPGDGAAGGVGYGLRRWGATLTSGSGFVAKTTSLDTALRNADIVVTGEGRYDNQTLTGKVVGNALLLAAQTNVTPALIVGDALEPPTCWYTTLVSIAGSFDDAIAKPAHWLREAARRAATDIARSRE